MAYLDAFFKNFAGFLEKKSGNAGNESMSHSQLRDPNYIDQSENSIPFPKITIAGVGYYTSCRGYTLVSFHENHSLSAQKLHILKTTYCKTIQ
jgi:hypothetical protein